MTQEEIQKVMKWIQENTGKKAYQFTLEPQVEPTIFHSKFGGLAYWDFKKEYPTDEFEKPMILLAQINFEMNPFDAPLPQSGILQFFIAEDAENQMYGLGEPQDEQINFRVVYHETIDLSVQEADLRRAGIPDGEMARKEMLSPVLQEVVIQPKPVISYPKSFEMILKEAIKQALCISDVTQSMLEQVGYEADVIFDQKEHLMLGYPTFVQEDPRTEPVYQKYDTLLLQIESVMPNTILWGDAGVGMFLIEQDALERLDFEKVLYHWDCC